MATETREARVERPVIPVTKLWVPGVNEKFAFDATPIGSNNYQGLGKVIVGKGQSVPDGYHTIHLAHAAYCSKSKDEPEFAGVRRIMKENYLYVFDNTLSTEDGVFFVYDPNAEGLQRSLTVEGLESRLSGVGESRGLRVSSDKTVAFARKGENFKVGYQGHDQLAKNVLMAGYARGWEGAEEASEVAATFKDGGEVRQPYVGIVEVGKDGKPVLKVAGLNGYWHSPRLNVYGDFIDYDRSSFALGVLK